MSGQRRINMINLAIEQAIVSAPDYLLDTAEAQRVAAKYFSPCRKYSKEEISHINKNILKVMESKPIKL